MAKLIFAIALPIICQIAVNVIDSVFALIVFVAAGTLYIIPFAINAFYIKQNAALKKEDAKISRYILTDVAFVTLPSIFSAVLSEIAIALIMNDPISGFVSVVLCVMFLLISAIQWLMYPVRKKSASLFKIKKPKK